MHRPEGRRLEEKKRRDACKGEEMGSEAKEERSHSGGEWTIRAAYNWVLILNIDRIQFTFW